jgi:hypothetical protein
MAPRSMPSAKDLLYSTELVQNPNISISDIYKHPMRHTVTLIQNTDKIAGETPQGNIAVTWEAAQRHAS